MNGTNLLAAGATVALLLATGASMAQQERGGTPPSAEKMPPSGARQPSAVNRQNDGGQNTPAGRNQRPHSQIGEAPQNRGRPETTGQVPREDERNRPSEQEGRKTDREENVGTVGSDAARARENINITAEKRNQIHEAVLHERNAPRVRNVNFDVSVGGRIPHDVRFAALPETIVEIEPAWRGFEFFMIGEEIVIVDPRSLEIVAIVDA